MIAAGDSRLRLLLDNIHTVYFDVDDERELFNVNTPEDLAGLERIYAASFISSARADTPSVRE